MFWFCPCPPQPQEPPDPAEEGEAGIHPGGARARAVPSPYPRWWVPHLCFNCWETSVALGGACTASASLWFLSLAGSPMAFGTWTLPTHPSVFPSLTQEAFFSLKHELCSGFFVCQKMLFWLKTCFNCGNPWMKCRAIVPTSKENYSRVATDDYDQLLNPKSWAWSDKFPHIPMHLMVSVFKQG